MIITSSSYYGEDHRPRIYPTYSYDTETQIAKVVWTAGGGWFSYSYLQFGIMFRRKVNGAWKTTTTLIGGMSGANYVEKWATSGSAQKVVKFGSNTEVCFVARCSASAEGGSCDAGWGSSWTRDSGWKKLLTETKEVNLAIKDGERFVREDTGEIYKNTSKYIDKIIVHWELPDDSAGADKVAIEAQDADGNTLVSLYPPNAPKEYTNATKSGNFTFTGLTSSKWYYFKIAAANTSLGEKIKDQWDDNYTIKKFFTRAENPYVYFEKPVLTGTSVKFYFRSIAPLTGSKLRLGTLAYTVHDDTTNKDIIVNKYEFKGVESDVAVNNGNAYGYITVTGLTVGHDYTITPTIASTVSLIPMAKGFSTSVSGAIEPEITDIFNSDDELIFGEPNGAPKINVVISGTKDVWKITLKIGTEISDGIVTNPVLTNTSAVVGTNQCSLTDAQLDKIYKTINTSSKTTIYASIEYKLASGGGSTDTHNKSRTMTLKGNAKTVKIGVAGAPRRAKAWIGVAGKSRRAVCWIGVAGKPRRTI